MLNGEIWKIISQLSPNTSTCILTVYLVFQIWPTIQYDTGKTSNIEVLVSVVGGVSCLVAGLWMLVKLHVWNIYQGAKENQK